MEKLDMKKRPTFSECLNQVEHATAKAGASDCLYRGESSLYPETYSSHSTTLEDINEVVYCFMQHYHLATPFIDLTTEINTAAAFWPSVV